MENKIINITLDELDVIKNQYSDSIWVVEMNGQNLQSWIDFSMAIEKSFKLPTSCENSIDKYVDWMQDLDWLNKEGYVLVIKNYSEFMKKDLKMKNIIHKTLAEEILPWWQSDVEKFSVGGKAKPFNVYLVD